MFGIKLISNWFTYSFVWKQNCCCLFKYQENWMDKLKVIIPVKVNNFCGEPSSDNSILLKRFFLFFFRKLHWYGTLLYLELKKFISVTRIISTKIPTSGPRSKLSLDYFSKMLWLFYLFHRWIKQPLLMKWWSTLNFWRKLAKS